jgi:hypothetical protein
VEIGRAVRIPDRPEDVLRNKELLSWVLAQLGYARGQLRHRKVRRFVEQTMRIVMIDRQLRAEKPGPARLHPTYYVRHPDETYSVADPQPVAERPQQIAFEKAAQAN